MAEVNEAQQTDFGMTDTNELQSTRAGSGLTEADERHSNRTERREACEDLKSETRELVDEYGSKTEQVWDDTRKHVRTFKEDAEQHVRDNPAIAIFTALGVGFVLGLLAFRR